MLENSVPGGWLQVGAFSNVPTDAEAWVVDLSRQQLEESCGHNDTCSDTGDSPRFLFG